MVDGIDDLHVGPLGEFDERFDDMEDAFAKAFAAMGGNDDQLLAGVEPGPLWGWDLAAFEEPGHMQHGVGPELPVTEMPALGMPSTSRFRRAPSVGAKYSVARRPVTRRFISSGKGWARSPVRWPASTCATGMWR